MFVKRSRERLQTHGEEIANSVSHGIGFVAILAGTPWLLETAAKNENAGSIIGAGVFAATTAILYLASTIYHALRHRRLAKHVFAVIDHAAIFLMIAGCYTPFTLGVLRGAWGWSLLVIVWCLAATGVGLKALHGVDRHHRLSLALYLGMGWLIVAAAPVVWARVAPMGLLLLVAGGLAYTAGVPFYLAKEKRYAHLVWHFFVMAGTTCHYFAILRYANGK
jgi:hemolysin III